MKHRLFTSIEIPPEIVSRIVLLQKKIDAQGLPIRWQKSEKLHLTLNFLGRVEEDKINNVKNAISDVTAQFSRFTLKPSFLETMYQKHDFSYIYLATTGDLETLSQIQKQLSVSFGEMDIPQPKKFLAHITIGFVQKSDPVYTKSVLDTINGLNFVPMSKFEVDSISLFESFLAKDTSHFQKIGRFMLR